MLIRNRIRELRRVPAHLLRPHPKNWRLHPPGQQDALRAVLAEIGYAGALVARELADGTLALIDGHLRAETTPDMEVPVLVVDLTDAEADKLLAVFDPVGDAALPDIPAVEKLLAEVDLNNAALLAVVGQLTAGATAGLSSSAGDGGVQSAGEVASIFGFHSESDQCSTSLRTSTAAPKEYPVSRGTREIDVPELFQLVVDCGNEARQRELYVRLSAEGYQCRVLTM